MKPVGGQPSVRQLTTLEYTFAASSRFRGVKPTGEREGRPPRPGTGERPSTGTGRPQVSALPQDVDAVHEAAGYPDLDLVTHLQGGDPHPLAAQADLDAGGKAVG